VTTPTFPVSPDKHGGTPLITPQMMLARQLVDPDLVVPEGAIMGYSPRLASLLEERGFERVSGYGPLWRTMWLRAGERPARVGVVEGFGVGAPVAAVVLEELAALGVRRVVSLGIAGALPEELGFADVVLCTSALRDEGTSHHYRPAERFAHPAKGLTEALRRELARDASPFVEGPTWTVDAIYRETLEEARAYRDEGIATVEMEAAALFVVAEVRGLEAAAVFTVSDHLLAHDTWRLAPDTRSVTAGLARILDASIAALSAPA
jgi:uridine phosphorylase